MKSFYITTTLPYVNADPHIGFGWEIVTADVLARFKRLMGFEVVFNTGTDEHGQKIFEASQNESKTVMEYVDGYAKQFKQLTDLLDLSVTHFIRTTDEHHLAAAQAFWKRCMDKGDIYKRAYEAKYCIGCELEKTDSELVDGCCPLHPDKPLDLIEEENYFFRFSAYQDQLLQLYADQPSFVLPDSKMAELKAFVSSGLKDFSVSRLKEKMPWGIEVPGDENHVMYVWFDALINYISTLGWPTATDMFERYWPGVQIAGKDNLRQQSAMWQAMLLSAGLKPSAQILINGFISVDGQKMSKSQHNVISPQEMVERYGVDGTRYLLSSLGPINGDVDVTFEKFDLRFNGYLANSLGNTVSRIATLCEKSQHQFTISNVGSYPSEVRQSIDAYRIDIALEQIWEKIRKLEKRLDETQPWRLEGAALVEVLSPMIDDILEIGLLLQPFMPTTAKRILAAFSQPQISRITPLFPRIAKLPESKP
jgi:methionyl-tRNA synthetase